MAERGHFTQIMGLKDSGAARFMSRQGSFDAVTLESLIKSHGVKYRGVIGS